MSTSCINPSLSSLPMVALHPNPNTNTKPSNPSLQQKNPNKRPRTFDKPTKTWANGTGAPSRRRQRQRPVGKSVAAPFVQEKRLPISFLPFAALFLRLSLLCHNLTPALFIGGEGDLGDSFWIKEETNALSTTVSRLLDKYFNRPQSQIIVDYMNRTISRHTAKRKGSAGNHNYNIEMQRAPPSPTRITFRGRSVTSKTHFIEEAPYHNEIQSALAECDETIALAFAFCLARQTQFAAGIPSPPVLRVNALKAMGARLPADVALELLTLVGLRGETPFDDLEVRDRVEASRVESRYTSAEIVRYHRHRLTQSLPPRPHMFHC